MTSNPVLAELNEALTQVRAVIRQGDETGNWTVKDRYRLLGKRDGLLLAIRLQEQHHGFDCPPQP